MKQFLILVLTGLVLSLAYAQTPGFGVYSGYPTYLGLQYQTMNLRFGAGLSLGGFGGDVALILAKSPLVGLGLDTSWYYGLGLGATAAAGGLDIYPHGLAGLEFRLPDPALNLYAEGQLGAFVFTGGGFGPYFAGRLGVILR